MSTNIFDDETPVSRSSDKVVSVFQRYTDDDTLFVNNTVFYPVDIDTETWTKIRSLILTGTCQVNNSQVLYIE